MARWRRLESSRQLLVAVTDLDRLALPVEKWASQLFAGGVDLIQVRQPELHDIALIEMVDRILAKAPGPSHVQINNRPDLAHRIGCGVHLPERADRDQPPAAPFSRSVHSPEAARASNAFDFVVAGHVFSTPSHAGQPGRGLAWLEDVVKSAPVPVVAIGGIDAENAVSCLRAGASGVAVIRALTATPDPQNAARILRDALDSYELDAESFMRPDMIEITLNGKAVQRPAKSTIQDLLRDRELVDRLVVVEINGTIIPRSAFIETLFQHGDTVELVHFVGGG